jgi:S-DNA-T family DNA segregation ATPase FtsK/SpoIIIE
MAGNRAKAKKAKSNYKSPTTGRRKQSTPTPKRAADEKIVRQRNQRYAVIQFATAILIACFVLITGDHIWLWCHNALLGLFGNCAILWSILLLYISIVTALEKQTDHPVAKVVLMASVIILFCGTVYTFSVSAPETLSAFPKKLAALYGGSSSHTASGLFGGLIGIPFIAALGVLGARIVLLLALFVTLMILTGTTLVQLFQTITKPAGVVAANISATRERRQNERVHREIDIDIPLDDEMPAHPVHSSTQRGREAPKKNAAIDQLKKVFSLGTDPKAPEQIDDASQNAATKTQSADSAAVTASAIPVEAPMYETPAVPSAQTVNSEPAPERPAAIAPAPEKAVPPALDPVQDGQYHMPPISMLETTKGPDPGDVRREIDAIGAKLVTTLQDFGVQTTFVGSSRGPAVTRYELQPAAGVKISKITNLSDDLSMNLATAGIRIEAPIPGKAAVGIEVPNKKNTVVRMRELVESNSFRSAKSDLTVALGRDIAGEAAIADLAKMPHLLIAGATGSGKSVCINSMIISLLYKSTPDDVRFLMIDPKVVELGIYNGIPQLLVPVVTDPRKAAGALSWAVTEMLNRYKTFAANSVRDLKAFNALVDSRGHMTEDGQPMEKMPRIVIIIDELADLMMAAPNEVEDSICRLAQMARAAGMHLVIATQRPSVDVITGIIKANIPSRIAFSVSSQVDSRTILDMGGAEKLLGHGDMLFSPVGSQKPKRIQGCFVSDSEIESVVNFVKKSQEADYSESIAEEIERNAAEEKNTTDTNTVDKDMDPMMPDAIKCVVEAGQASTSFLQRRLRLGYSRAGRLIDQMEQKGIIGPADGSKPRQVLITYQQWLEMNMQKNDAADAAASHE